MNLNKDVEKRDMLLFGEGYKKEKYTGGVRGFSDLTLDVLEALVKEGFIDPEETQNCSPTTEDFMDFMGEHSEFTVFGYAVTPDRHDYRVTIEGIESKESPDFETLIDFVEAFRFADGFDCDPPYAWWD